MAIIGRGQLSQKTTTDVGTHQKAGNPKLNADDDVYCRTEAARANAELVRLDLDQEFRWPRHTLLWAFLLRAVQTLLYIHACTVLYCLKTVPRAASSTLGQSKKSNNTCLLYTSPSPRD